MKAGNCWVLVHTGSNIEWNNGEYAPHLETQAQALEEASRQEGTTPRLRDQACLIVACGCGECTEVFDESGAGYPVHFDSADDAESVTEAEWTKHADGTYRCVACSPSDGDCDCLAALASQQSGETR